MLPYPDIDPVAVSVFSIDIHWYGLMYLFGFIAAWLLSIYRAGQGPRVIRANQADDLVFYGAMGVVAGARIGYILFYDLASVMEDPLRILRVWEGGMSFHGGLIGTALALWLYARKIGRNFFDVVDFIAPFAPIGIFFGRLGNFIGAELWGRASDVPWAMVFPTDPDGLPRHPSQLYEAFLEGIVLFVILFWYSARPRPRAAVIGAFVMFYGLFRFSVEFVREPDAHIMFDLFGWVTRGQLLSIPMMMLGAGLLVWTYRRGVVADFSNVDTQPAAVAPTRKRKNSRKTRKR